MGQSDQAVWSGILRQEVFPHLELLFIINKQCATEGC